jgi:hypothetical protein
MIPQTSSSASLVEYGNKLTLHMALLFVQKATQRIVSPYDYHEIWN